ncbi:uncharacterized protein [Diabrotica undecimpunctata]|uniref:uncharacterized protein n=1 Tax=Diabrotica undecimpunctata TaxID=50387 RepID=UPI003B634DFE
MTSNNIVFRKLYQTTLFTAPPWMVRKPFLDLSLTNTSNQLNTSSMVKQCYSKIDEYQNDQHINTDASKSEKGVGYALIHNDYTASYKISNFSTVYTAELFAIYKALELALNVNLDRCLIITDSLSSMSSLGTIYLTHSLLRLIKSHLYQLQQKNANVKFMWIPSHIGIHGNERVDAAAKSSFNNEYLIEPTYKKHFHHWINSTLKERWFQEWNQSQQKLRDIKTTVTR